MSPLPTGEVTFMFTDIEGSTRLVEALGEAYERVLGDHCAIIRRALAEAGGLEVSTHGDSFFAVFTTASAAVRAAAQAQRQLRDHAWPKGSEVRVRMGLHSGAGQLGGQNYAGLDVHRAARVAAAGHGGQVLLSGETVRTLGETDLEGVTVRDLGPYRLKDLSQPVHIYQLEIDGVPAAFPPIRSLDARPNNLPAQVTSFVGRRVELAQVRELLDRARLVTLTGPGGTGKTRLSIEVAADRLARHRDGAFFVDLSSIGDHQLVPSAIAGAIGVKEEAGRQLLDTLVDYLRARELLLVLDNFERVLEAAPTLTAMLSRAPGTRILATSRARLDVHGEHEFPVPPLGTPTSTATPTVAELERVEGVALFVDRALAARPTFALTPDNAPAVAEIVRRLDGLPLALELAAAKLRVFHPEQVLRRLDDRLALLVGGARDLPPRQQTLRAAIDWSHDLLGADLRGLFRRLAVFTGGSAIPAAQAVVGPADLGLDALAGLTALAEQSLVRLEEPLPGESRFQMLESIREYAAEKLAESGEADELGDRHAAFFMAMAEAAEPQLTSSPEAIERVARDLDNMRSALSWAIEHDDADTGLRLGHALWRFWQQRGHLREGRQWFDSLLALPSAAERSAVRARGLTGAAGIAYWQNDYAAARGWYEEAELIVREHNDSRWLTEALYNTSTVALLQGDMAAARARLGEGALIARALGDEAIVARFIGAEGYVAFMGDDLERARPLLDESLALLEKFGSRFEIGTGHHTVAQVARLQGRLDDAADHYRAAIRIAHELGDAAALTEPLSGLAAVAVARGDAGLGVRLLAACAAIRERLGGGPPPEWLRLGDPLGEARAALGGAEYERQWRAGEALEVDAAVERALEPAGTNGGADHER